MYPIGPPYEYNHVCAGTGRLQTRTRAATSERVKVYARARAGCMDAHVPMCRVRAARRARMHALLAATHGDAQHPQQHPQTVRSGQRDSLHATRPACNRDCAGLRTSDSTPRSASRSSRALASESARALCASISAWRMRANSRSLDAHSPHGTPAPAARSSSALSACTRGRARGKRNGGSAAEGTGRDEVG